MGGRDPYRLLETCVNIMLYDITSNEWQSLNINTEFQIPFLRDSNKLHLIHLIGDHDNTNIVNGGAAGTTCCVAETNDNHVTSESNAVSFNTYVHYRVLSSPGYREA
jgi:hypothetical protein